MTKGVLVSPIGLSPGAITGLAITLMEVAKFDVSRVVTVGTSLPGVIGATQIVGDLLRELHIDHDARHIPQVELRQSDGSTEAFMIAIGQALEAAHADGSTIHVGVTGGRSGMGALASLATNIYGADHLWHLWVTDEIEQNGRYDKLPRPYTLADNKYLNPSLGKEEYELVELPFLDLRPFHPLIWDYFRAKRKAEAAGATLEPPKEVSQLIQILVRAGVSRLASVFPATLSIESADRIIELTQLYATLPRDREPEIWLELGGILEKANIIDPATRLRLQRLIQSGAEPESLQQLAISARDPSRFWAWYSSHLSEIETGATVLGTLLQAISLWSLFQTP